MMTQEPLSDFRSPDIIPKSLDGKDPPWRLSDMPNYSHADCVETVCADEIQESEFYAKYVSRNTPCLLKGAAKHWRAIQFWSDPEYLKRNSPNLIVPARVAPICEDLGALPPALRKQVEDYHGAVWKRVKFHDCIDRACRESGQFVVHSISLGEDFPLSGLGADVGNYAFLPKRPKPRMYPPLRAFFYRESYADWHYHPNDETLFTQAVGRKEVLLLPPDQATWDTLFPIAQKVGFLFAIDAKAFPKIAELRPMKVLVEAGDALYIPAFWWHAVASCDDEFGVSVAATFKTPIAISGDMKYPAARRTARFILTTPYAPFALWIVGCATAIKWSRAVKRSLASLFKRAHD